MVKIRGPVFVASYFVGHLEVHKNRHFGGLGLYSNAQKQNGKAQNKARAAAGKARTKKAGHQAVSDQKSNDTTKHSKRESSSSFN